MTKQFGILFVFAVYIFELTHSLSCSYVNKDESYDMGPLTNNQRDYILNYDSTDPEKKMFVNLCRPTITTVCGNGVAICQQWDPKNTGGQASLGQANTLTWTYGSQKATNSIGLIAQFSHGDLSRKAEIDFVCKRDSGIGMPKYWDEIDLTFYFAWVTEHACPQPLCYNKTDCYSCNSNDYCYWCLDNNNCYSQRNGTNCQNRISNPSYCPNPCSKYSDCTTCTKDNQCHWCLDNNSCKLLSDPDCTSYIKNPQFCPSR